MFEITLHAGDALYLPTCWWHAVTGGAGPNISFIHWYVPSPTVVVMWMGRFTLKRSGLTSEPPLYRFYQRADKADHAAWRTHVDHMRESRGAHNMQPAPASGGKDWNAQHSANSS